MAFRIESVGLPLDLRLAADQSPAGVLQEDVFDLHLRRIPLVVCFVRHGRRTGLWRLYLGFVVVDDQVDVLAVVRRRTHPQRARLRVERPAADVEAAAHVEGGRRQPEDAAVGVDPHRRVRKVQHLVGLGPAVIDEDR